MSLIFIDLEMKPIEKSYTEERKICGMEIIEIGAVRLNDELQEIGEYRRFVKPYLGPEIPERITELTGITQGQVADAPAFQEAITDFFAWCGTEDTIYAWSDSDLRQVRKELRLKRPDLMEDEAVLARLANWKDFQKSFTGMMHLHKRLSLENAVNLAGMDFSGRAHDALTDARNTADLYRRSKDETEFARIQKLIEEAFAPKTFTMADMFDFSALSGGNNNEGE